MIARFDPWRRIAGWAGALAVLACLSMVVPPALAQGHSHAGHDHSGHDHGHDHGEASGGGMMAPRISARGDEFELVGILRGDILTIYLDRLSDNAPVEAATIELQVEGHKAVATDEGKGVYKAGGLWLRRPGPVDILFTIGAAGASDLLVGTLEIPGVEPVPQGLASTFLGAATPLRVGLVALALFLLGGIVSLVLERMVPPQSVATVSAVGIALVVAGAVVANTAPTLNGAPPPVAPSTESPRRHPDGDVVMPKPTQRILALRTVMVEEAEIASSTRAVGRIISDPAASGFVQTTIRGRVELADHGWPVVGQKVKRGDVLAVVVPAINPVDRTSIRGQITAIEREIGIIQGRIAIEERKDDFDAQVLDSLRSELSLMVRRRASISQSMVERDQLRLPLHAPVDGVIASAKVIPGQIVETQDVMFEVIDPNRLWVEVAIYDLTILDKIVGATAVTADSRRYDLKFLSRGPRLNQQFVPVYFTVQGGTTDAVAGTPVSVMIATTGARTGVILPQSAIVRGQGGQSTVWVHSGPELFVPRLVVTEGIDGRNVLATGGLDGGTRIVTSGAGLVNQVR